MFNVGIIGAGPAGYTLAIKLAQKGKKVILFEKKFVGGTCLNVGCIPTKTILCSCDLYDKVQKSSKFGICADNVSIDFSKVNERKNSVVEKLRKSLEKLIKSYEIEIVYGNAKILDSKKIECESTIYECENIVVATGSEPFELGNLPKNDFILNSNDILDMTTLPKSILIIGSGAIGMEWARIFSTLKVEVHLVELAQRLLPAADIEVSERLNRILKRNRVKLYLSNSVENTEVINENEIKIGLKNGENISVEKVLVAVGRKIVLPESNVDFEKDEKNRPVVNEHYQNKNGVFIIGDAASKIQLAHNAIHQALLLADYLCDGKSGCDYCIPSVIYGSPEIAWVGKTEQDLEGTDYKKSIFPVSALGKAQADGEIEGFVKLLSLNNKLVGAHIISPEASSLICEFILPIQKEIDMSELENICHPHPSYSEASFEAILGLNGLPVNVMKGI